MNQQIRHGLHFTISTYVRIKIELNWTDKCVADPGPNICNMFASGLLLSISNIGSIRNSKSPISRWQNGLANLLLLILLSPLLLEIGIAATTTTHCCPSQN